VEIAELLGQVLELARAQTGPRKVVFRSVIGAALPAVEADPIQIQQVVLNLLHNAVEAVQGLEPERQRVTLRAAIEAGGDGVEIAVSDLGPGCPPDVLPHIFEPQVTTKPDSLGLGLAISRSIVEAHGGKLWAVPNSADGLSFHFSLPARKDQQHEFAGTVPQLPVRHASDGLRRRR
jgi:signal transduction histidine kinase